MTAELPVATAELRAVTAELPVATAPPAPFVAQSPRVGAQRPAAADPSHGAPATFAELLALDAATRVRWLPVTRVRGPAEIAAKDRDMLAWVIAARCALSSQIHRRMNPGRSLTTTQRALKRLADAGLIRRFQLHRDDGGGVPMCCAATTAAFAALCVRGRRAPELRDDRLDTLRRDIHVVGWLLAFEEVAGNAVIELVGPGRATVAPADPDPAELRLEHGRRMRDFFATRMDGSRGAVERFAAVRPDAVVTLGGGGTGGGRRDLLVIMDRTGMSHFGARGVRPFPGGVVAHCRPLPPCRSATVGGRRVP